MIAIESEREFGLSVLQPPRCRSAGIATARCFRQLLARSDIAGFRDAHPDEVDAAHMLLIVDEFQEFFTEDDRTSQDAAQLLDRLVRQGRAFGLHILLGSQTLGGEYSLPRSTIDQMAVRIALQCSESDAQLILSADNTAARLLTRPGEAIYNDANGRFEGNHPFQVVWLPEAQRAAYLQKLRDLAAARMQGLVPALVFEGNAPADLRRNEALMRLLQEPALAAPALPRVWLGEAMAIKEPTSVQFRKA